MLKATTGREQLWQLRHTRLKLMSWAFQSQSFTQTIWYVSSVYVPIPEMCALMRHTYTDFFTLTIDVLPYRLLFPILSCFLSLFCGGRVHSVYIFFLASPILWPQYCVQKSKNCSLHLYDFCLWQNWQKSCKSSNTNCACMCVCTCVCVWEREKSGMFACTFMWLASWGAWSWEWGIIKNHLLSCRVRRPSGHSLLTGLVFLDALRHMTNLNAHTRK